MDNHCGSTEVKTASYKVGEFIARKSAPITTSFLISHYKERKVPRIVSARRQTKFTVSKKKILLAKVLNKEQAAEKVFDEPMLANKLKASLC